MESFKGAKHPSHSTCLQQQQTPPQNSQRRPELYWEPQEHLCSIIPCRTCREWLGATQGRGMKEAFSCPGNYLPFRVKGNPTERGYTSHSAQHNLKWTKRNCLSNRIFLMAHFKQHFWELQGPDFQPKLFHCPCSFLGAAECRLRHDALMPEYLIHEHKQILSHLSSLSYTQK